MHRIRFNVNILKCDYSSAIRTMIRLQSCNSNALHPFRSRDLKCLSRSHFAVALQPFANKTCLIRRNDRMGRHPIGVALFITHFAVFCHFPPSTALWAYYGKTATATTRNQSLYNGFAKPLTACSLDFTSIEVNDIPAIASIRLLAGQPFAIEISIHTNSPHDTALRIVFQRRAVIERIDWHGLQKLRHERTKRLRAAPRLAPVQFRRDNDLCSRQPEFAASKFPCRRIVRSQPIASNSRPT